MKTQIGVLVWRLERVGCLVTAWLAANEIKKFTAVESQRFIQKICFGDESMERILFFDLRFHHTGTRMSENEMKDLAKLLSGEDAILGEVLLWNMHFNGNRPPDSPSLHGGVYFWSVGENASHQFSAGTKDGKRYGYSVGEGFSDDTDEPTFSESMYEVPNWSGYWGHF